MHLDMCKAIAESIDTLREQTERFGAGNGGKAGLTRTSRELLFETSDRLRQAKNLFDDFLGYEFDYYGEPVEAEIQEDDGFATEAGLDEKGNPEQSIVSASPFMHDPASDDRFLRERALSMAVGAGEKGSVVAVAEKYYAFMKGESK